MNAKERIIAALDVPDDKKALELADELSDAVGVFKVGMQLFTAYGPDIIKKIHDKGGKVFLDLKFHDIPNTVEKALRSAVNLGVFMTTVHTAGGYEMLKAAAYGAGDEADKLGTKAPVILGVTVLTSLDINALADVCVSGKDVAQVAEKRALLAKKAGIGGLVSSPLEVSLIRKAVGKDMTLVTPGVRPKSADVNDQKRIATPKDAVINGADYIVVGRPITGAPCPKTAAENIAKEINL